MEAHLASAEIYSLDAGFARDAAELIKETRKQGDSLGATVEVVAVNVPPLVGEPLYQSLKVRLMGTLGGLNAAQFCEIGDGRGYRSPARQREQRSHSPQRLPNQQPGRADWRHHHRHAPGLPGGLQTNLVPSSRPQQSVRKDLEEIDFMFRKGRHDPCVGVRAGVTLESRMAIELLNAVLAHETRHIDPQHFQLF